MFPKLSLSLPEYLSKIIQRTENDRYRYLQKLNVKLYLFDKVFNNCVPYWTRLAFSRIVIQKGV